MGYKQNFGDTGKGKRQEPDYFPLFIAFLAILSFGRIWFYGMLCGMTIAGFVCIFDQNLEGFLNTGYRAQESFTRDIRILLLKIHKNSDYVYLIWHSINIFIQIASPVFLYLFLKNLLKGKDYFHSSCLSAI